jgi:hypothetical protein
MFLENFSVKSNSKQTRPTDDDCEYECMTERKEYDNEYIEEMKEISKGVNYLEGGVGIIDFERENNKARIYNEIEKVKKKLHFMKYLKMNY